MAITYNEVSITWSSGINAAIAASGNGTSDQFTIDQTAFRVSLQFGASHSGTAAAGQFMDFYLLGTAHGDVLGTTTQGIHLYRLNPVTTNPAYSTPVEIPLTRAGTIYALSTGGTMTVSASLLEQRSA